MAKKTPKADVQKMQAKERRQEKLIDTYKKQSKWITWAAVVILLLILFFVLSMGYASNWWQNPSRTSQFNPYGTSSTLPTEGNSATTTDAATNTGGPSTSTNSGTTTNNTTTESTTTTTVTNNTTPAAQPGSNLLTLLANTTQGKSVEEVIAQANSLGIPVDCRTELLVQVCDFTEGAYTLTTKNLLTGLGITGISTNF